MKSTWTKKAAVAFAIVFLSFSFVSGSGSDVIVENLVCQRVKILDDFFDGKSTFSEASDSISAIESGNLLREDINMMQDFFRTDIEKVLDFKVKEIKITYEDDEIICAAVSIEWQIERLIPNNFSDSTEKIISSYSIIVEKYENSYKLVQFF